MNKKDYSPNPDDRSDNVEKLQNMVQDTIYNIGETEDTMEFSSGKENERIREKNKRREQAIDGMRQEIQDEYQNNLN